MMQLLDSNIIIYATKRGYERVTNFLDHGSFAVSDVSRIEVLGFHGLTGDDYRDYDRLLSGMRRLPIDLPVVEQATTLRRQHRMSLGDAIISATALRHDLPLVTHNTSDFDRVKECLNKSILP